jgi:hypothetical protein
MRPRLRNASKLSFSRKIALSAASLASGYFFCCNCAAAKFVSMDALSGARLSDFRNLISASENSKAFKQAIPSKKIALPV